MYEKVLDFLMKTEVCKAEGKSMSVLHIMYPCFSLSESKARMIIWRRRAPWPGAGPVLPWVLSATAGIQLIIRTPSHHPAWSCPGPGKNYNLRSFRKFSLHSCSDLDNWILTIWMQSWTERTNAIIIRKINIIDHLQRAALWEVG